MSTAVNVTATWWSTKPKREYQACVGLTASSAAAKNAQPFERSSRRARKKVGSSVSAPRSAGTQAATRSTHSVSAAPLPQAFARVATDKS